MHIYACLCVCVSVIFLIFISVQLFLRDHLAGDLCPKYLQNLHRQYVQECSDSAYVCTHFCVSRSVLFHNKSQENVKVDNVKLSLIKKSAILSSFLTNFISWLAGTVHHIANIYSLKSYIQNEKHKLSGVHGDYSSVLAVACLQLLLIEMFCSFRALVSSPME